MWFHQSSSAKLGEEDDEKDKLNAEDYDVYINPKVKAETEVIFAIELCEYRHVNMGGSIAVHSLA
jgi:hypothetical protein